MTNAYDWFSLQYNLYGNWTHLPKFCYDDIPSCLHTPMRGLGGLPRLLCEIWVSTLCFCCVSMMAYKVVFKLRVGFNCPSIVSVGRRESNGKHRSWGGLHIQIGNFKANSILQELFSVGVKIHKLASEIY